MDFMHLQLAFQYLGTLMIEPTESESKVELDDLLKLWLSIRKEINEIAEGKLDKLDNPLKNAPHTSSSNCR